MSPDDVSYVPLLRKIGCSEIIRHAELFQLWGYLLIHAAYHPRLEKVKAGRSVFDVMLQLGEVFVQVKDLSQFLNQPMTTLKRNLDRLAARGSIAWTKVYGGRKVKILNAERYWLRRDNGGKTKDSWSETGQVVDKYLVNECTHSNTAEHGICRQDGNGTGRASGQNLDNFRTFADANAPILQGLPAPLEILEILESPKKSITPSGSVAAGGGVGEPPRTGVPPTAAKKGRKGSMEQLPLIQSDPVPIDDQDDEMQVSVFLTNLDEPAWQEIQSDIKWIRATLKHRTVAAVLKGIAEAYEYWVANPKDRWKNIRGGTTAWLRRNERPERGGQSGRGTRSIPVPPEPGKYDGIGITVSTDEE